MKSFLSILVVILLAVTLVQLWLTSGKTNQHMAVEQQMATSNAATGEAQVGGDFALTDSSGKTVHATDFRGRLMLVFFGYTHCPDICPVTVANLSKTMTLLGPKADQVAPVFISVDPTRDTPAVMKDFLSSFDPHLVGLTGTPQQIQHAAQEYKAYYAQPAPASSGMSHMNMAGAVDHSAFIYLMGKDGRFIKVFPNNAAPQELAQALGPYLQ